MLSTPILGCRGYFPCNGCQRHGIYAGSKPNFEKRPEPVPDCGSFAWPLKQTCADVAAQSSDDVVYEQDILRDPGSVKPWLAYVDFKLQHGTLLEQAYV